jgi:hypothetical protein
MMLIDEDGVVNNATIMTMTNDTILPDTQEIIRLFTQKTRRWLCQVYQLFHDC